MNSDKLKPCPFCGQMPRNDNTHHSYPLAHCTNQDCVGSWMTVGAGGFEHHWNTRPLEDALQAQLSAVKVAYGRLMNYRHNNTLNFQLEKLDDYLRELNDALEGR